MVIFMEKLKVFIFIIIFCSILILIYNINQKSDKDLKGIQTSSIGEGYQVIEMQYNNDGVRVYYPYIASGASEDKLTQWNNLIKDDLQAILQIYSFQPFAELEDSPLEVQPARLLIVYEIKLLNNQFLSIFYKADYNSPHSAHPTQLVYTTNIDTQKDIRLTLKDLIKLDSNFASSIRQWDFATGEPLNKQWNMIIKNIIKNMSDEDILNGLKEADKIGTGNPWGMFTYITPDTLGISISVPNYVGDHVEFEKKLTELKDYLNPAYDWNIQ